MSYLLCSFILHQGVFFRKRLYLSRIKHLMDNHNFYYRTCMVYNYLNVGYFVFFKCYMYIIMYWLLKQKFCLKYFLKQCIIKLIDVILIYATVLCIILFNIFYKICYQSREYRSLCIP